MKRIEFARGFLTAAALTAAVTGFSGNLVEDLTAEAGKHEGVSVVAASPYATGGDLILKLGEKEYVHVFTNAAAAADFAVGETALVGKVLLVGGGGGSGAGWKPAGWNFCTGGGGGGGGVATHDFLALYAGKTYTVTVGAGGEGGTTAAPGATGGTSSLSGNGLDLSVLGGGGGGSGGSTDSAISSGTTGATGGGASGYVQNGGGTAVVGTPGGSGDTAGGAATVERSNNLDRNVAGGGGGGAGGAGQPGRHESDKTGAVVGGAGLASDIFGFSVAFGGGGAGGSYSVNGNGTFRNLATDGGGSSCADSYGDQYAYAGADGYGGGAAGEWFAGGRSSPQNGLKGGSGLVAIRYAASTVELDPALPMVRFDAAAANGETSIAFNWLLRTFGDGADGAKIGVEWGRDGQEKDHNTILVASASLGEGAAELAEDLLPGRVYSFRLYAENSAGKRGYANEVKVVATQGGKSSWKESSGAQNKANGLIVDFAAKIGYVGENTSTVTFRWKFGNGEWQEETLGTFDKDNPPPSSYRVQKMFLDYDVVSYEFVVRNAAADINWSDVAEGRVGISDGKINESYWATKDLGIVPVLNGSKTKTVTLEKTKVQREYNYYTHAQDPAWGETYTGTDTFIVAKPVGGDTEGRPLCVFLHGRGGSAEGISGDFLKEDGVYNAPDDFYCIFLDNGRGNGAQNLSFRYWWGATGNWRGPEVEGVASYRQEPATAKRVLDCVEWLVREKKIDRNRIYMAGNSMGGQGTLAIGLPHGEIFAAIEGNVPATVWYTAARMNFVDDAGIIRNAEDRDATAFVDPPPCFDWSGSDDGWSRQHEVLLESMNRFRYSYTVLWGAYGHCGSISDARQKNDLVGRFDWKQIRKNAAYPCFSNATGNDQPPWPWATATYAKNAYFYDDIQVSGITYSDGATMNGQRNAWFRWENVSDTAEAMKMKLWVATAEEAGTTMFTVPESQTADVTIRRVQGFKLLKNQPCAWTFGGQSGMALANAEGVVTVNLTITHEHQELTLEPRPFAYLVAKSSVCTVGEREISVIANVQALGGAEKAVVTADYRAAGETEWTHLALGEQGEGPALYTIGSLKPNVKYAVKVTIDNGQDAPIETNLGTLTTLYYTLAANAALDTVTESSVAVAVDIEEIGTSSSEAAVKILYRADSATAWTTKDCGTQKRGSATYAVGGLGSGVKYWFKATVDNGVDAPAEFVLGSAVTLVSGDKALVEPPVVRDVKFTGSPVTATVPASELWTVVANAGGTAEGRYTVTLKLTDAEHSRWVGSETDTIELAYNVVAAIPGLTLPAGAEWFSEKGDVVITIREGEDAALELAYDAYADILLVAGGGPGGMASAWQNGLPGAGGGAGGMLEQSGVTLAGGTYRVTVGKGGEPGTDHGKQNNKGGDTKFVGEVASFSATGGGGGGHASTADGQSSAACGANGGSSGGSLLSLAWGYWSPAITADACKTYCTPGQGNPGGRISTGGSSLWVGSVGGGGAGEPAPWADTKNPNKTEFLAGGAGRASSISGESVVYAAGGDGGLIDVADAGLAAKNGADGLGNGGAGASFGSGKVGEPGRGGDGIVVIRLREYFLSGCAHAHTHVQQAGSKPTCTEGGFTDVIVCDDCGLTLTKRAALPPLGHKYVNDYCSVCGAESRFHRIEQMYWSNDRRYVFVDAHRGMTNEVAGIPHSSAAAFRYAIEIGADVIELDPKPTADGVIIVMHDANMEPEVYGPVSGIVGSGATANWAGQVENYILRKGPNTNEPSDQHVLTMAEALDICKDQCFLQIDCNYWTIDRRMDQLWDLICEKGMQRQCIFIEDNLKDWPRYQQQGAPEGMVFRNPARWDGGTLNQNQPDGFNDRSSFPDPTKFGWQRVMDQGSTVIMTDTAEALIGYLDTLGRHTLEPETDTRRMVTPLIPSDIVGVKGKTKTYGATDTDDYTVVSDEGGSEKGEYFVTLRLRDSATTRWTDTTDGDKKMWYHLGEIDPASIDGLPTDFEGQTAEYPKTGSANGLSWANAARAYAIGGETVLIFSDPAAATSFRVLDGYDAAGRYLLVGGGGPGGMNGTHKAHQAGSGGGAGGMLEGTVAKLASGTYAVTVGAGGKPGTDHGKVNNKGGDSVVAGGAVEWRAVGGGGGGHGSTGDDQKLAARGVNGGSSGGSQFYYDTASYGSMWSISDVDWLASFVEGQGHHGGRVAGYKGNAMQIATAGGGGAGDHARAPGEEADKPGNSTMENAFGTGGAGRASDITGMSITYAGGGAGGTVTSISTQRVAGGFGGGGSTDFSRSDFTGAGVDMLGGGGAGASYKNGTTDLPGRGGSGVVIVRLTTAANGDCTHPTVSVTKAAQEPTCIEKGWTAEKTCDTCHKVIEAQVEIPALGHDFKVEVERVEPTATRAGYVVRKCSRCEERRTTPLPPTGGGTASLPTMRPGSATPVESGDVDGVLWSGASGAWRLGDGVTTVVVFTNAESAASFTVANGFMVTADILAVGGGGAGGSAGAGESGAGGSAGAMVESFDRTLDSGDYAITVGAGGVNASGGESSVGEIVRAAGGAAGAESGKTTYGGWGGDGAGEPGHRPLGSEPGEGTWLGGNGGAGKVAYLTGCAVTYAGGGAGGSVGWQDYKQTSGGAGGGGGTVENWGGATSENGVDGLGGGGAGTCSSSSGGDYVASEPGRGGNGVVVICITEIGGSCDHAEIETIPAVAATCETAGSTEGRRCKNCQRYLVKPATIPALGHSYGEWAVTTPATCEAAGEETRGCQREGCTKTETRVIAALGHSYGEWTVTTPATCEAAGEETRSCQREGCTKTETRPIAQLAHAYDAGVVTKAATCEEDGLKVYTCTNGCHSISNEVIAALGHLWDDGVVTKAATTNAPGEIVYTCQREGEGEGGEVTTRTEVIPQLPCNWFDVKFADYALGTDWTTFGSPAPDGGVWTLTGRGEETETELKDSDAGRFVEFAAVSALVYRASSPSPEGCDVRITGRMRVQTVNELPGTVPALTKAGLCFLQGVGGLEVHARVGNAWKRLDGDLSGLADGLWADYQADFVFPADGGAAKVTYRLNGKTLDLDGETAVGLAAEALSMNGVAFVGTAAAGDFKGQYWLKVSPIIPLKPADAPIVAADGLVVDSASGKFSITVENPVNGLYYAVFTAEKLTDEFVAEVVTEPYAPSMGADGKLTLEVLMDESKPSKFARVAVLNEPVKAGDPLSKFTPAK